MNRYWSKRIQDIVPYTPGEQPKDQRFIKLNTNECPYPPSPKAVEAIREAAGDKKGIRRYGSCILPMDDALVLCAVDLGGRPYFSLDCDFTAQSVGSFETALVREFFYAVSYTAGMNLHLKKLSGVNDHHIIEAMFKAFAKALDTAVSRDERIEDVLSTKGSL